MKDSNIGILNIEKLWRFKYYLRNMRSENQDKKIKLVKLYEDIILKNLIDKVQIKNIMILPVAVRITELLTKTKDK